MNKYSDMTDKDVNRAVHIYMHGKPGDFKRRACLDYCNDWGAIGPVIDSIWPELMFVDYKKSYEIEWDSICEQYKCDKKRAAAICFLMMKEAEQ